MNIAVLQAYRNVFDGHKGSSASLVMEDLKRAHFFYGPTVGIPIDPYALAYNEGQRNVILRIMSILESKEEDYGDNRNNGLSSEFDRVDVNAAVDALYPGKRPGATFDPE